MARTWADSIGFLNGDRLYRAAPRHHARRVLLPISNQKERTGSQCRRSARECISLSGPKATNARGSRIDDCRRGRERLASVGRTYSVAITELVEQIAMKKLLDGQFEECALTLKELDLIKRSLVKSLTAIYHGRIKYPDQQNAGSVCIVQCARRDFIGLCNRIGPNRRRRA